MERNPRVSNLLYWKSKYSCPNLKIWCVTLMCYALRNVCISVWQTKNLLHTGKLSKISSKNNSAVLKHLVENSKFMEFSCLKNFELRFYKILLINKRHREICILSTREVYRWFSFLMNVQESEHISFDFERSYLSQSPFQSIFLNKKTLLQHP